MTDFKTLITEKGVIVYTIKGISMMPLIRQYKDVLVIKHKTTDFKINDTVLFIRDNGQYVLHRIRGFLPDGKYNIIGDNCPVGETVREDQIIGIMTEIKRNGKIIKTDDFKYKIYVLFVPLRRAFLKYRNIGIAVLRKIYHLFKRKGNNKSQ